MNLGTHMSDGERRKPIDIEVVGQKSSSHCPSTCSQLGFCTFGALLIFFIFILEKPFIDWIG
jgi:hypothetical protein